MELPANDALPVDLNRDERIDLLVAYDTPAGPRIGVLMNLGDRAFAERREIFPGGGTMLLAGDFTGDLAADVLVIRPGGEQPAFLLNDGFGNFELKWGAAPALIQVNHALTGDFNRDGNLDVAASRGPFNELQLFHGDGSGLLVPQPPLRQYTTPIAAGDFDRDGADEVVSVGRGGPDVTLWRRDGAVAFPAGNSIQPNAVAADFDGDGAEDLAVAGDLQVTVLLNDGQGALMERARVPMATYGRIFAAGDFDRDADLDLVVPSGWGIAVMPGNGDGTFRTLPRGPRTIGLPADVDGDGAGEGTDEWIDVIDRRLVIARGTAILEHVSAGPAPQWAIFEWHAASRRILAVRDGMLTVYVRDGAGTWRLEREVAEPIHHATLGDFTGDGVPELAYVTGDSPRRAVVLAPSGSTLFVVPLEESVYDYLTAADVNGDGRTEVVYVQGGRVVVKQADDT
ncbi:MAG TPA: VCBS repeat-containing protein, partial [Thermoanaerobaculia bacterium]|nr:VCBS repeat-containing protein [Thermoanaerobaculia bacterium]